MPIPIDEPVIIPAVPAKTFDSQWIRNFAVRSYGPTDGYIYIELVPFNSTTGEIDHSKPKEYNIPLWTTVANVAKAALAMNSIFEAIPDIEAYVKTTENHEDANTEPEPTEGQDD